MASNKHPSKLFVEVTTCCNLQCGMCVKQNGMGGIPEGIMSTETFEQLAPAFPHLDSLVLNGLASLLHPTWKCSSPARALLPESLGGIPIERYALTEERAAARLRRARPHLHLPRHGVR
jgi:hypothetical protein